MNTLTLTDVWNHVNKPLFTNKQKLVLMSDMYKQLFNATNDKRYQCLLITELFKVYNVIINDILSTYSKYGAYAKGKYGVSRKYSDFSNKLYITTIRIQNGEEYDLLDENDELIQPMIQEFIAYRQMVDTHFKRLGLIE